MRFPEGTTYTLVVSAVIIAKQITRGNELVFRVDTLALHTDGFMTDTSRYNSNDVDDTIAFQQTLYIGRAGHTARTLYIKRCILQSALWRLRHHLAEESSACLVVLQKAKLLAHANENITEVDDSVWMKSGTATSKEAPPQEEQDDKAQRRERPVLFQHELPVDSHGGPPVLFAVVPEPAAELPHLLQVVSAVQQVLDVLVHHLGHVAELVVELVEVLARARVGVGRLRLCDEVVELHEGVRAEGRVVDLLRGVGGGELASEVGEVGERELSGVGGIADAEEDDVGVEEVVEGMGAGVDAGLGLGVAGEFAQDLSYLILDFGEGGFGLRGCQFWGSRWWAPRTGRLTNLVIINGCAKHQACFRQ